LDLFYFKAWRWPSEGRNMSPWQCTISGPQRKQIQGYIYVILDLFYFRPEDDPVKVETCRPDSVLFQALKENRSKITSM